MLIVKSFGVILVSVGGMALGAACAALATDASTASELLLKASEAACVVAHAAQGPTGAALTCGIEPARQAAVTVVVEAAQNGACGSAVSSTNAGSWPSSFTVVYGGTNPEGGLSHGD